MAYSIESNRFWERFEDDWSVDVIAIVGERTCVWVCVCVCGPDEDDDGSRIVKQTVEANRRRRFQWTNRGSNYVPEEPSSAPQRVELRPAQGETFKRTVGADEFAVLSPTRRPSQSTTSETRACGYATSRQQDGTRRSFVPDSGRNRPPASTVPRPDALRSVPFSARVHAARRIMFAWNE